MRARVVPRKAFRSFVASVGMTYGATVLCFLLPTALDRIWEAYPPPENVHWTDPAFQELPGMHYRHVASGVVLAALLLAAIVPWLVMFIRARAHEVEERPGEVRIGTTTISAKDVTAASVAPDGRGVSVAIGRGDKTTFLEVDRMEDARQLLSLLGRRFPIDGRIQHKLPRGSVVFVQAIFSVIALFYAAFVSTTFMWMQGELLGPAVLAGVLLSFLTLFLVIGRMVKPMAIAWDATSETAPTRTLDRSPLERHVRRHLEGRLREDPAGPRVRVDLLARGDDTSETWLARIDALRSGDAYRGNPLPKDVLFEVVADDKLAIDTRVAAARLLARRDGENADAITREVSNEEVRARVLAVVNDDEATAAAESLDAVGPLFQTDQK